jgi:hypothetical protein
VFKVREIIYGVFKGSFFTKETASKNWFVFMYVVMLLLIVIYSSHSVDQKIIKISELKEQQKEFRAIYIDTDVVLTKLELESTIIEKAKERGLETVKEPPQKIRVTY